MNQIQAFIDAINAAYDAYSNMSEEEYSIFCEKYDEAYRICSGQQSEREGEKMFDVFTNYVKIISFIDAYEEEEN